MRDERGRRERTRERLRRHRGGVDRHSDGALDLVLGARDDDAHKATAAPTELRALLEPDPLDRSFEVGIREFEPLLGNVLQLAQVAPSLGLGSPFLGARVQFSIVAVVTWRVTRRLPALLRDGARELVELRLLLGEVEHQLLCIDPLGRGDEDPATKQLELFKHPGVRLADIVALLSDSIALLSDSIALLGDGRQSCLQSRDARIWCGAD